MEPVYFGKTCDQTPVFLDIWQSELGTNWYPVKIPEMYFLCF